MNKLKALFQIQYAMIYAFLCSIPAKVKSYWVFKKFFRNRKGQAGALGLVVMLVMFGIILIVGLYVTANLFATADGLDLGATGNATRTALETNIWAAYDLSVIIPIVAAAGAIISTVVTYLAFRHRL